MDAVEQGRLECQIPLAELCGNPNGFWDWFNSQPKPSSYKEPKRVKVSANMHISTLRDLGHKYFDIIWCDLKLMSRPEAYAWLAGWLDISPLDAHFSKFNEKRCIEAIEASIQLLNDNRRLDLDLTGKEPYPYYELIIK